MLLEVIHRTNDVAQIMQNLPPGQGPTPFPLHQMFQITPHFGAVAPNPGVISSTTAAGVAREPARCLPGFDLRRNMAMAYTGVGILLFLATVMVIVTGNGSTGDEKITIYESMAMNSVGFVMIYFTTRLPNQPNSIYHNVHRAAEVVGIGISVFLFFGSLLIYLNIALYSAADKALVTAIIFITSAFGLDLIVLIFLMINLCCVEIGLPGPVHV